MMGFEFAFSVFSLQVARNLNETEGEPGEAERAQAENRALAALSDAFSDLFASTSSSEVTDTVGSSAQLTGRMSNHTSVTEPEPYHLVVDGDDLARAASGLSTGAVRAHGAAGSKNAARAAAQPASRRPRSPTSPLDLAAPAVVDAPLTSHPSEEMAGALTATLASDWYLPGGALDVLAVEKHMISVMQVRIHCTS